MKHVAKYIPIITIIILFIVSFVWGIQQYFDISQLKKHQTSLELFITQHEISAVLIYSIIYITITGVSIPGATLLTVVGGFLFGQLLGTFAVVISATLGASVIYFSVKLATSDVLQKKAGPWLTKMQQGFKNDAASYILTLRLIPLFPFVAVNLVCAILNVPFRTFFFTTLIGIIPGSFVYVSLGVAMREVINQPNFTPNLILHPKILLALTGLGILALLPVMYKKFKRN